MVRYYMKINIKYLRLIYRMFEQLRSFINYVKCSFRCCNQSEPESEPETPKSYLDSAQPRSSFFQDVKTEAIKINSQSVPEIKINEGTPILNKKLKSSMSI